MLVLQMASAKHYVYATEVTIKNEQGKNIRPDGILMNELRIHKGYVESKDSNDTIDQEINKKLYKDGYPTTNILFQDSTTAVLIQNGEEVQRVDMKDASRLEAILKTFIDYKPKYLENFEEALGKFKEDIPTIVQTLRELIEEQNKVNPAYTKARDDFWEMCKQEINPEIKPEDIREMVIQHILTEDLFKSVFDESDFHHENNIAHELERLVNTFMNRSIRQNQLGELGHYYKTLNAQAASVADHHEKQRFLKVVYENFYKVYNPKGADRLGVVYTPNEIVDFMIRSTDYLLEKHFGRHLHDQNVHILDPATGTGTFITDLIEYIPAQYLEHKYKNEIHANEVAILPYYVANLNIEFTYKQKMGTYAEFPNICFVDTLDNIDGLEAGLGGKFSSYVSTGSLFGGMSKENAVRIKRQNDQKISVVIGNPPYNANQANFNDFNKNREYPLIDKRIKNTFVKESTAQKTKVYDMYARFYRWAMDRIDKNGVISFITNRSFIDSRTFDGFRKCIQRDFDYCYIIDTRSDVRANPKIAGTTHNVFGIQTGVAMMFLVKKEAVIARSEERTTKQSPASDAPKGHPEVLEGDRAAAPPRIWEQCRIYYNGEMEDDWRKEQKLEWIKEKQFTDIRFENIIPKDNNWINLTDNDWDELVPLASKDVKSGNSDKAVFELFTLGAVTNRDDWMYDFSKETLISKITFFHECYEMDRQKVKGKKEITDLSNLLNQSIKWTEELEKHAVANHPLKYNYKKIRWAQYRPFIKKHTYFSQLITHRPYQNESIWGIESTQENRAICITNHPQIDLLFFSSNTLIDQGFGSRATSLLSLYRYDSSGTRHDNITDWGLERFRSHYSSVKDDITKEAIFHYTYGVLHHPAYREKYALNLKRDFPRLPLYADFWQWVTWGKTLMELHIGYESVKPFALTRIQSFPGEGARRAEGVKAKLKADKAAGTIQLDDATTLSGIPAEAWEYKLGNRSALEWVLDQYKEKKPKDKTIAEKFNTYRFADYKEHVIDLLCRVCTVSVETMKVVREMEGIIK